jgi:hypothetical protein
MDGERISESLSALQENAGISLLVKDRSENRLQGWENYLLLHHFDPKVPLDKLRIPNVLFRYINWYMYCLDFRYLWNGRYYNDEGTAKS